MTREVVLIRTVAAALVALFLFGACSSEDPTIPAAVPSPTEVPTATKPVCPLTGKEPPAGVKVERPAVAVKIENSPLARPQRGLANADLVFEEIVEGGITRFMAIYHCGAAKDAGPVRSARFDDPKLARPFTRVIAFSGSNGLVNKELGKRNMVILNELNQRGAFFRVPPGAILVHNLFVRTEVLRNDPRVRKVDAPQDDVFTFGDVPENAKRARRIALHFDASIEIGYRWRGGEWKRFEDGPFRTDDGEQIAVANVLVQQVEVNNSSRLVDSAGNPSPKIDLKHGGKALLFRDGRVLKGTWKAKNGRFVYKMRNGDPFVFAPGAIWVELVPSKKGEVKGSIAFR
ncbi:MAG: DUF3048 domain-containing protein [Actinomycetota bacterium]|nr:DUF3048 domain-containing protein [Actinomycetota bacterium]